MFSQPRFYCLILVQQCSCHGFTLDNASTWGLSVACRPHCRRNDCNLDIPVSLKYGPIPSHPAKEEPSDAHRPDLEETAVARLLWAVWVRQWYVVYSLWFFLQDLSRTTVSGLDVVPLKLMSRDRVLSLFVPLPSICSETAFCRGISHCLTHIWEFHLKCPQPYFPEAIHCGDILVFLNDGLVSVVHYGHFALAIDSVAIPEAGERTGGSLLPFPHRSKISHDIPKYGKYRTRKENCTGEVTTPCSNLTPISVSGSNRGLPQELPICF